MDKIDAILRCMPATRLEIRIKTGMQKSALQAIIERLHERGWIHICGWERILKSGTGKFVMRYKAGPGRDKPCKLEPMSRQELESRRRAKLAKTGAIAERNARNLMRYHEKRIKAKAKAQPHTWLSALTG
jgi:hypothetical protein